MQTEFQKCVTKMCLGLNVKTKQQQQQQNKNANINTLEGAWISRTQIGCVTSVPCSQLRVPIVGNLFNCFDELGRIVIINKADFEGLTC